MYDARLAVSRLAMAFEYTERARRTRIPFLDNQGILTNANAVELQCNTDQVSHLDDATWATQVLT